ncbi:MAG: hypothetical protein A2504_03025 [Bdellovibrionales bacterium RIFOXYD12_FULL_39_22]|nr:MAG: hypothetical protein A2385_05740 [Bdellovibrionales bacterium RIFOXYB1_FULL_39_21]OFZ42255.1 MAG: hypothetical protein A2485_15770 [Bdellovibrionales bacterium RIFOXYC12_FULL_39_17]OFZ46653.1 MAG: hypothetical protein A2404_03900 [Bdellovibrionales bacterium RIFOXYC1_FULL_39_130]OFZ76070.1 MAG: hypothetical protein A2560_03250 [Bdellovibrionales bacterium RIFOXYD1_FULL_39_84]OFZ93054.1 MAG: hypothetical protein A2504_03025 [Bdellovibrionales bacterium RIFOXYD12_FULL_39_22]HLE09948.1 hy
MKQLLLMILLLSISSSSFAQEFFDQEYEVDPNNKSILYSGEYRMGLFKSLILDTSKITHVIVIGSALDKDSDQFFQSGLARAQRYSELWPDHQVIIMSSPEVRKTDDETVFAAFSSVRVVSYKDKTFTDRLFISELKLFSQIASIDFFGHASPWVFKLGKMDANLDPTAKGLLSEIKPNLMKGAYATISSCNSGFNIAPLLSAIWEIPVAGALSSSLFERYQSDGMWYKEGDLRPSLRTSTNMGSFLSPEDCALGLCWRMKPSRNHYSAYWGTFREGGLSFYKFFCNFDDKDDSCEKSMATSLLSFSSVVALEERPNREDFERVVFDWLCSTGAEDSYFTQCVEGIKSAVTREDFIYKQIPGNALECDFRGCNATVVCKKKFWGDGPQGGSCHLKTSENPRPTTIVKEYLAFMRGFELL